MSIILLLHHNASRARPSPTYSSYQHDPHQNGINLSYTWCFVE
uniref:Uncharacterized protein n=1 Tax=Arundo donax TaxID=35708 RepID=A0A0A8YK30_ARUDO